MTTLEIKIALSILLALSFTACSGTSTVDSGTPPVDSGGDGGSGEDDAGPDASLPSDAGTDAGEPCAPEGSTRVVPCGNCGTGSQMCAGGVWQNDGGCFGEGECPAGMIDRTTNELCGQSSRLCDGMCRWGTWRVDAPDGECRVDAARVVPEASCGEGTGFTQRCGADCTWQAPAGPCVSVCGPARRTSPPEAEEICIPAGPFVRGGTDYANTQPVATINLSSFSIDRHPVTNDRYRACVTAGACAEPATSFGQQSFRDSGRGNYPVQGMTWAQARDFCAWDGGRVLPTEAQYEKAARGPAPRTNRWPWDGDSVRCDLLQTSAECGFFVSDWWFAQDPIGSLPGTASYYGVEMLTGEGRSWTRDEYVEAFYADPASRVDDPIAPLTGSILHTIRGGPRQFPTTIPVHFRNRDSDPPETSPLIFRCSRPVSP